MIPTIQIDLPKFIAEMNQVPAVLVNSIKKELKHQLVEIQKLAMKKHRHKTRTGTLNSSLQRMVADNGLSGQVYFETGIADYGVYVHEGHHSWKPDQFLYEALAAREPTIISDMENAINQGLLSAGLK
jgi:hypothetical protein